jgi:hypothetical protein
LPLGSIVAAAHLRRSPVGDSLASTSPWRGPSAHVASRDIRRLLEPDADGDHCEGSGGGHGFAVRLVLPVLAAHLTGTVLTFVMLPQLMFRGHNPFLLTESGEFVAKNLVLIAATVVLIAHTGGPRTASEAGHPIAGS